MTLLKKTMALLLLAMSVLMLVSCGDNQDIQRNEDIYKIYQLGLDSGLVDITYEEWLESIRGEDADQVYFRVEEGYIQWRRESENIWSNLYELKHLVGPKGDKGESGEDGREVTFRIESGYIQWQYVGSTEWTNLIEVSSLVGPKGDKGESGEDGREVTFRVLEGYLQWQYEGDSIWINLIELSSLIGPKGDKGESGEDGREVILRVESGYIQWQYVGSTEWTNLIEVSSLVGPKGQDGITPHIGSNGNWWIGDFDTGVSTLSREVDYIFSEIISNVFIETFDIDTLSKYVTINTAEVSPDYDYELSLDLVHEFTRKNSNYNPIYFEKDIIEDYTVLEIEVPFHGLFNMEYTIKLTYMDETYEKTFVRLLSFYADEYNIAWLNGTMPVLLAASDILSSNKEIPSYVELIRPKTFNFNNLPKNMHKMPLVLTPTEGNYDQNAIAGEKFLDNVSLTGRNLTTKWLEELFFINPRSKFNIMVGDNRTQFINSLLRSRIPFGNIKVIFYTDGSGTTNTINSTYTNQTSFDNHYNTVISQVLTLQANLTASQVLATTKLDNFEYVVNSIDGWNLTEELKNNIRNNYNVRIVTAQQAFDNVENSEKLSDLERLLNTRWGDGENDGISSMFKGEPIKNLLILGTSTSGEVHNTYATFEQYIQYIVEVYGDEYKIFYKGHPSYPPNSARLALFNQYNIQIIPNSIPVETVMLLYPEIYVGGYTGTSFQSSLPGQTLFFFGTIDRIKSNATLKDIIEQGEIFYNTEYLSKDFIENYFAE